MSAPLPFGGGVKGSRQRGFAVDLRHQAHRADYDEQVRNGRRWAPRSTLLLAAGVSSAFWVVLAWIIAENF